MSPALNAMASSTSTFDETSSDMGFDDTILSDWDELIPERARKVPKMQLRWGGRQQRPKPMPMACMAMPMAMPKPTRNAKLVVKPVKPSRKRLCPAPPPLGPPGRYVCDAVRQQKVKMMRRKNIKHPSEAKAFVEPQPFLLPKAKTKSKTKSIIICID